jgi:hypothetical protein
MEKVNVCMTLHVEGNGSMAERLGCCLNGLVSGLGRGRLSERGGSVVITGPVHRLLPEYLSHTGKLPILPLIVKYILFSVYLQPFAHFQDFIV